MDFLLVSGAGGDRYVKEETPAEENVELSLGLSLNGRFGVEPRRPVANKNSGNMNSLIRASSVADFLSFPAVADDTTPFLVYESLTRTCSLPAEPEEWKKRKELQSVRRSAAKRKRVEKRKNERVVQEPAPETATEEKCEAKRRNLMNGNELWGSPPTSVLPPLPRPAKFPSPASVGSPGSGGSSGVSDLESPPFSGINKEPELKSTATQQPTSCQVMRYGPHKSNDTSKHVLDKFSTSSSQILNKDNPKYETLKMMLADMPCVSTKGDGIDGKKIEGFLYRYKNGEDVRIVCVCHGNFLSPAEFVKHGGGGDVEHPLRHIVINPPSL